MKLITEPATQATLELYHLPQMQAGDKTTEPGDPGMADKISRNDPCPCGSGKKFKHCCWGKDIDWGAKPRFPSPPGRAIPRSPANHAFLAPFAVIDARLKEIAKATTVSADLKERIERLSLSTPDDERIGTYKAIRQSGILPEHQTLFLFGHAVQWLISDEDDLDRHTVNVLRKHGLADQADLYVRDRLAYDRQYERGRQFFIGPPDELLAATLRAKGIIA